MSSVPQRQVRTSRISNAITVTSNIDTYHYYACVDPVAGESDPSNNCSSAVRVVVSSPSVGARLEAFDFNLAAGNTEPRGIWSDGTTLWVADQGNHKIYAYDLEAKAYDNRLDFNTLSAAENRGSEGIWSDGSIMWVSDYEDDTLYAYDLATKARVPVKDFNTLSAAGNTSPSGIWSDGTNMWVVDWDDRKLYAYDMASKARNTNEEFNLASENSAPRRIWSDGTTMWVVDLDDKIYAYDMVTKTRVLAKDFTNLSAAGNTDAGGIWSDGTTMWVADSEDDKIYAYDARSLINTNSLSSLLARLSEILAAPDLIVNMSASSTSVLPSNTITLMATVGNTGGRSSSTTTLRWYFSTNNTLDTNTDISLTINTVSSLAADTSVTISNRITVSNSGNYYYYACVDSIMGEYYPNDNCSSTLRILVSTHHHLSTNDFNTLSNAGNTEPRGIWSDGNNMWVADSSKDKIYGYDLATKAYDSSLDFNTLSAAENRGPEGIWSDGSIMWVSDYEDDKIYAYDLATKARVPVKDFNTLSAAGNTSPSGIWSDGTTMWVVDWDDRKLYAYDMASKARNTNEEFNLASENSAPRRIWSDGTTMWVADTVDDKIYAYELVTKTRVPAKDFNTLSPAGNTDAGGIWSDGTTMWVADTVDDKIYAYVARSLINTNSLSSLLARLSEILAAPDLIVNMSASSTSVLPSNTITLMATVGNTGGRSSSTTTLRWYFSTNNTLDTNTDISLTTNTVSSLAADTSVTISNRITVPSNSGTYYYYACVDPVMGEILPK